MLDKETLPLLKKALSKMDQGFENLPPLSETHDLARIEAVLMQLAGKMQNNFPYFHPFYAGQMLKPPHPVARLAYMLSLWINPNNHALDGGRASSAMEKEAVAEIAAMFGWGTHLGHLTGGGTMANMEALWIAGRSKPGLKVVASSQAHYTHQRISDVLSLPFQSVSCDRRAKMDVSALRAVLDNDDVGTVVATMGTTGPGSVDPLPEILSLRDQYGFHLHADAAYGGYFTLARNLDAEARACFDRLGEVDSIVIDPHKHGLQPYGCGCILFKNPEVGKYYKHDSPYTYFSSEELHLGEISLECSRPGSAAAALWATQKAFPLVRGGKFSDGLSKGRAAALALYRNVDADARFRTIFAPELDIVVWAPTGRTATEISERSRSIFVAAGKKDLHLATFHYPAAALKELWPDVAFDRADVICLRSCLMKAEHEEWIAAIWRIIDEVADDVIRQ